MLKFFTNEKYLSFIDPEYRSTAFVPQPAIDHQKHLDAPVDPLSLVLIFE